MPGTTVPTITRATRSRYSSPAVNSTPNGGAVEQASLSQNGEKRPSHLGGWVEPAVQQKSSFEEAGLMRYGVVENMAPLGTLPKAGVFRKAAPAAPTPQTAPKPPGITPIRRIVLKTKTSAPQSTPPKPTPAPVTPAPRTDDDTEEEESGSGKSDSTDDMDDEATPVAPPRRRSTTATQEADDVFRPCKAEPVTGVAKSADMRRSMSRTTPGRQGRPGSMAQSSPSTQPASAIQSSRNFENREEITNRVVACAVDEALKHCRYPTAWALRTLYDENSGDSDFLTMLEDIFTQTADNDTVERYTRLLHQKKNEGRKDRTALDYFGIYSDSQSTPRKAKPAPYGNLITAQFSRSELGHATLQPQYRELQWHLENPGPKPAAVQELLSPTPGKEREEAIASTPKAQAQVRASAAVKSRVSTPAPVPVSAPAPVAVVEEVLATPPRKKRAIAVAGSTKSARMTSAREGKDTASTPKSNGKTMLRKTPTPRRQRASSTSSSSSSLSSARSMSPPDDIEMGTSNIHQDDDENSDESLSEEDAAPRVSPAAPAGVVRKGRNANASSAPQPITTGKAPNAAKKTKDVSHLSSSSTPTPSSPPNKTQKSTASKKSSSNTPQQQRSSTAAGAAFSMPSAVDSPVLESLSTLPPKAKNGQKTSAGTRQQKSTEDKDQKVFASKFGPPPDDEQVRMRLKAKKVTQGVSLPESFSRYDSDPRQKVVNDLLPGYHGSLSPEPSSRLPSRSSAATPSLNVDSSAARSTRAGQKRTHDEVDESSTTSHFPSGALDASSTAATSRDGTPVLRPPKRARSGLRVKTSPMKKKSGTSAGIPRPSGERTSPAPNGHLTTQDENDDYCASCGGNGELLCCDGCTRAFHLTCVDPPLASDRMPAEWFCNTCLSARDPTWGTNTSGAFGGLLAKLEAKNSSAFRLPQEIREYFEGVQTGADGEYEEAIVVPKPTRKRKAEEEAVPDFHRVRDREDQPVLCHHCQQATAEDRVIIPCSVCGVFWHLDCLDPPLSRAPPLRTWKCPLHVDELVNKVPGYLGPAHKYRKIKDEKVVDPIFPRGNLNNGYIEVIDDLSEDESGLRHSESFGRIFRLRASAIEKDFFYKLKKDRKAAEKASMLAARQVKKALGTNPKGQFIPAKLAQHLDVDHLERLQAAHNLAQLSNHDMAGVNTLIDALISEATPATIALMARANPEHIGGDVSMLDKMDDQALIAIQIQARKLDELIQQRLKRASDPTPTATTTSNDNTTTTSSSEDSGKELPSPPATEQPDDTSAKHDGTEERDGIEVMDLT